MRQADSNALVPAKPDDPDAFLVKWDGHAKKRAWEKWSPDE